MLKIAKAWTEELTEFDPKFVEARKYGLFGEISDFGDCKYGCSLDTALYLALSKKKEPTAPEILKNIWLYHMKYEILWYNKLIQDGYLSGTPIVLKRKRIPKMCGRKRKYLAKLEKKLNL